MDFAELKLKMDFKDAEAMTKALTALGLTADKVEKAIDQMGKKTVQTTTAFKNFQRQFNQFSGRLASFSGLINTYVTLPLIGAGAAAIKMANDLNRGMANVATLIPEQTAQIREYREEIQRLSVEVGKPFDDLTRGLYEVISAFPGTTEAIEITELAARTARAGLSTTKQALDLLSATTKAYGDTSYAAQQRVADLAFTAVKYGQTTFLDLSQAIQKATTQSVQLGISQEELFAVFSTFTGVTGNAEMAATQLRSALISLLNPTGELDDVYTSLNVASGRQLIEQEGLVGAFEKVGEAIEDVYKGNAQAVMRRIEGITFATQIATTQNERYRQSLEEMADASGAMQEAFEAQTGGINAAGFILEQSIQRFKNSLADLGQLLSPEFARLTDSVSKTVEAFTELDQFWQRLILQFGKDIVVFGLVIGGLSGIATAMNSIIALADTLSISLAAVAPYLLALGTIAAVGTITIRVLQEADTSRRANEFTGLDEIYSERELADFSKALEIAYSEAMYEGFLEAQSQIESSEPVVDPFGLASYTGETSAFNLEEVLVDTYRMQTVLQKMAEATGKSFADVAIIMQQSSALTEEQRALIPQAQRLAELQAARTEATYAELVYREQIRELTESIAEEEAATGGVLLARERLEEDIESLTNLYEAGGLERGEREYWERVISIREDALSEMQRIVLERGGEANEAQQAFIEDLIRFLQRDRPRIAQGSGAAASAFVDPWRQAFTEFVDLRDILKTEMRTGFTTTIGAMEEELQSLTSLINKAFDMRRPVEEIEILLVQLHNLEDSLADAKEVQALLDTLNGIVDKGTDAAAALNNINKALPGGGDAAFLTWEWAIPLEDLQTAVETMNELEEAGSSAFTKNEKLAAEFALSMRIIGEGIRDAFLDNIIPAFTQFGEELANTGSVSDSAKVAFQDLVLEIIRAIPMLFIQAGLAVLPTNIPLGLALIAAGMTGSIAVGYMDQSFANAQENNAKGGVYGTFAMGGAFTNSIVNTPTTFAFANGTGLMGEAGPEAIMPLTRTQDGNLGVRSVGGETNVVVNVVNNVSGTEVQTQERQTPSGKEIDVIISAKVSQAIANGSADRAMSTRYGVRPRSYR